VLLIWAASAMMTSVRHGINVAWDSAHRRFFLRGKLLDLGLVALLGALAIGSLSVTLATRFLPDFVAPGKGLIGVVIPMFVSFAGFVLAYRVLPAVRTYIRDVWPAALGAALVLEIIKAGFAFYLGSISNNDVIYGSVGAIISFLLFVYLASNLLLLGAEFAAELPRVRAGLYDSDPDAPTGPSLIDQVKDELRRATEGKPEEEFRSAANERDEPPPDA
jgi:membrane protein